MSQMVILNLQCFFLNLHGWLRQSCFARSLIIIIIIIIYIYFALPMSLQLALVHFFFNWMWKSAEEDHKIPVEHIELLRDWARRTLKNIGRTRALASIEDLYITADMTCRIWDEKRGYPYSEDVLPRPADVTSIAAWKIQSWRSLHHNDRGFLDSTSCAEAALMKMRTYCLEQRDGSETAPDEVFFFGRSLVLG